MPVARIDINRIDIAVVLSLLAHGLIAAIPIHDRSGERAAAAASNPVTFVARIVDAPVARVEPAPVPEVVTPVVRPRPVVAPKVAALAPSSPAQQPVVPVEPSEPRPAPTFDMLAMINARRERRQQVEEAMARQEQARSAAAPGSSDPLATINRNLQGLSSSSDDGTGGIFTILSKGTRTAEFSFNGWRPESNRRWREVIEVDAGPGGDLELAIVRRMIQLIRGHYSGDFVWRSHRLDKSIVLSARVEDSRELEEFLIREFFGTPTLAHKH